MAEGGDGREGGGRSLADGDLRITDRVRRSRVVKWLLFTGDRSVVAVVLLGGVLASFVLLALARPVDIEQLLSETTTLQDLFLALLRGAILVVSIVTSISSIVLSAEIADITTEEERVDASLEFRRRAEEMIEAEVSPGRPADFLQTILYTVYTETLQLQSAAMASDDEAFRTEVEAFADDVLTDAKATAETLDGAQFGTFRVLSAGLHYDYSWQLNTARRLEQQYDESLTDSQRAALSDLIDTLKFFGTGREYFQSLYYKREMARLSSSLLYVSLPVIVFISYLILALDGNIIPNARIGRLSTLSVFALFAYTVSLAPYVVLTAHVIRLAAVTLRTLSAGPFILRPRPQHDVVDVEVEPDPNQWDRPEEANDRNRPEETDNRSQPEAGEPDHSGTGDRGADVRSGIPDDSDSDESGADPQ